MCCDGVGMAGAVQCGHRGCLNAIICRNITNLVEIIGNRRRSKCPKGSVLESDLCGA